MEREDERLRLFVAIDLPEDVRESLGRLQSDLRRHDLPGLRWTRPEGVHLTLKFLGETPASSLAAIEGALARAVRGMEESGKGSETAALRAALEGLTRSLAEGAQLLEDVQRRTEPAGGGLTGPQDGAATLRRMMALAEGVAAEHRKMEGDLAKLLEGFLPDAAAAEGKTSSALDAATST